MILPLISGRLHLCGMGFGVDELLDLLDLQDPIRVGGDGCDENRLAGRIEPVFGRHLGGELREVSR